MSEGWGTLSIRLKKWPTHSCAQHLPHVGGEAETGKTRPIKYIYLSDTVFRTISTLGNRPGDVLGRNLNVAGLAVDAVL